MKANTIDAACNGAMIGGLAGAMLFVVFPVILLLASIVFPTTMIETATHLAQSAGMGSSKTLFLLCFIVGGLLGAVGFVLLAQQRSARRSTSTLESSNGRLRH